MLNRNCSILEIYYYSNLQMFVTLMSQNACGLCPEEQTTSPGFFYSQNLFAFIKNTADSPKKNKKRVDDWQQGGKMVQNMGEMWAKALKWEKGRLTTEGEMRYWGDWDYERTGLSGFCSCGFWMRCWLRNIKIVELIWLKNTFKIIKFNH